MCCTLIQQIAIVAFLVWLMAYFRNSSWVDDDKLKKDLEKYTCQGFQRKEILSFMERDYVEYSWSLRTLDRRLRHFGKYQTDPNVTVEDVRSAVQKELDGPGKNLGYRAMHNKIRQVHELNVPRHKVHNVMYELDPVGLENRALAKTAPRLKGRFTTRGSNWVHSFDGHAKLMGYQRDTFPLAIYGCIDTASRRILWLRIWISHSNPKLIGRWYFDYLYNTKTIAAMIRIDKGTETGTLATLHAFLRRHHEDMDPMNTVIYGPSTDNQIERWWRELHERLEQFYKHQLRYLKDLGYYNPHDQTDRLLLAYLFIPLLQHELDMFRETIWNTHRIRYQDTYLPNGIPDHVYNFPEEYGLQQCGWKIIDDQLKEAAFHSGILDVEDDYLEPDFRARCEEIIAHPADVKPKDCVDAFLYLKEHFFAQQSQ